MLLVRVGLSYIGCRCVPVVAATFTLSIRTNPMDTHFPVCRRSHHPVSNPATLAMRKIPEKERLIRKPEALLTLLLEACYAWTDTAPDERGDILAILRFCAVVFVGAVVVVVSLLGMAQPLALNPPSVEAIFTSHAAGACFAFQPEASCRCFLLPRYPRYSICCPSVHLSGIHCFAHLLLCSMNGISLTSDHDIDSSRPPSFTFYVGSLKASCRPFVTALAVAPLAPLPPLTGFLFRRRFLGLSSNTMVLPLSTVLETPSAMEAAWELLECVPTRQEDVDGSLQDRVDALEGHLYSTQVLQT